MDTLLDFEGAVSIKQRIVLLLLIIACCGLSGCMKNNANDDSLIGGETNRSKVASLTITAGEQTISSAQVSDPEKFNSEDVFKSFFIKDASTNLPVIRLNETLELNFEGEAPNKVTIKDVLLNSEGGYMYPEKVASDIALTSKEDKFSFVLEKNLASGLSSAFDPAKVNYRGFKIKAAWASSDEQQYIIIIKQQD